MNNDVYRVLVVDDERLTANNIAKNVLRADEDFEIVGIATDGELALKQALKLLPHIVITDIKMPVMDGLELMNRLADELPQTKVIIVSGYNDFDLVRTALQRQAFDYLLKPINLEELRRTLAKLKTMIQAHREMLVSSSDPKLIVDSVKQYLRENYAADINISEIADEMGYSASYITRIFKLRSGGMTPVKYLTDLRISAAKRYLVDSSLTVKEIAPLVGYPDPFHFSRSFKQYTGVNPQQYRHEYHTHHTDGEDETKRQQK